MNIPKRIQDLIDRKERMLEGQRAWMDKSVLQLQETLFSSIIKELIPKIDVVDGLIVENEKNLRLLTDVDKLFNDFQSAVYDKILPGMTKAVDNLNNLSKTFFTISLAQGNLTPRFERIIKETTKLTNLRLGLDGGKVVRGGFLWSLVKGGTDNTAFKQFLSRAITSQMSTKEFITATKEMVLGTEAKSGMFDRQFKRYAYDVFQQYDASYNKKLAEEFKLKYFIYQGGLVKDSRDFCIAHNDKVFSTQESEAWKTWTPQQSLEKNEFPEGYTPKDNLYQTPSYMNYDGYDPLVDRGGYNCRHILAYISDNLAEKLRPDLKGVKPKEPEPPKVEVEEYKDLDTITQAEEYAHNTLKIRDVSFVGTDNVQMPIINEMLRSVKSHFDRFPELKGEFDFIGSAEGAHILMKQRFFDEFLAQYTRHGYEYKEAVTLAKRRATKVTGKIGPNTWAQSYGKLKGIGYHSKWSVVTLQGDLYRCVNNKWHPRGCYTFKSLFDHEMGHRLDKLLGLSYDREMQDYFSSVKTVARRSKRSLEYWKENLSEYAWSKSKNSNEFIAEAWAEYQNTKQPREIAVMVGKMIEKKYKDKFGD